MHQIRYFLAVSQTLNFTRAAADCHVAQPSLTRAIKLLEAELGSDLFRRERNLTHLTDFGQRMLPLLRQCYESAASAKKLATSMRKGAVASLTLSLSRAVDMALIAEPLAELVRAFPALELKFLRGTVAEVAEHLKRGDAALAVSGQLGETWERLDEWPLFVEPYGAVVGRDHPLAGAEKLEFADLSRERLLSRPYCELAETFEELARSRGFSEGTRHEVVAEEDLIRLVGSGLGIAVMPWSTPCPPTLKRLPVEGLDMMRTVSLYGVAGRERTPQATALMRMLRARDWSTLLA